MVEARARFVERDPNMTSAEILVGVDGSASARAALEWAARYARATRQPLRALHVLVNIYTADDASTAMLATENVKDEHAERLMRDSLSQLFSTVTPEPDWRLEFAEGLVGPELVLRAARAQLLVVGTREHTGVGRLINGSVSHYCLKHAPCPVVAVPASAPRQSGHGLHHAPAVVAP